MPLYLIIISSVSSIPRLFVPNCTIVVVVAAAVAVVAVVVVIAFDGCIA